MIEEFKEWYGNRHEYAKKWKKENPKGKALGYCCTYVPLCPGGDPLCIGLLEKILFLYNQLIDKFKIHGEISYHERRASEYQNREYSFLI